MEPNFERNNGPVDEIIDKLMEEVGGIRRPWIVREMIVAALKAGQEDQEKADLKLMNASLKEMRHTARVFAEYEGVKKVTVFGSARCRQDGAVCSMARRLGRDLAKAGYMVITGGGPGIMQAANEGAGPENSFGVNIRLPFEQKTNAVLEGNPRSITYKYFFNRKVAFLKESDAAVLFPGGFGTMDEAFETLTLVQTGKRNPLPVILADAPGGNYWKKWLAFIKESMLGNDYISETDFHLFELVDSVEGAAGIIERFYRRYHSLRYIKNRLAIRLSAPLSPEKVNDLKERFPDILVPGGDMALSGPLEEESNEVDLLSLQRLVLDFNRKDFGRLRALIDALNE